MSDPGPARRGRRPGQVRSRPAPEGFSHDPETRVGWLLRGWRLQQLPDSSSRGFAELLRAHGASADASRVSRWETGQLSAPLEVVQLYEEILGLPLGGVLGVTALQRRMAAGPAAGPSRYGAERVRPAQVERLLDAVVDGRPTGRDWFELGTTVATLGDALVLPTSVWQSVTGRLLDELGRSIGNAYIGRSECSVLLTTHPSARRALVYGIGEHVTTPGNFLLTDPMAVLQEVEGPQANDLVLRLLDQPQAMLRNAAAWAAAGKLARGHFGPAETARLEQTVARLVRTHGLDRGGSLSRLVDLVAVLPGPARANILELAGPSSGDADEGEVVDHAAARALADTVLARAVDPDPLLGELVSIALCHEQAERRFLAAFTLQASAHQQPLGAASAAVLERYLDDEEPLGAELAHRLMVLFSIVAGVEQQPLLARILAGPHVDLHVMALTCLAHLPGAPVPDLRPWIAHRDDGVARAAGYCAGMTGDPCLVEVEADESLPGWRRRMAAWWLRHGSAIHEPAPGIAATDVGTEET